MNYAIVTKNSGTIYTDTVEFNDEWMGSSSVTATIESPTPIDWSIGDYITYRGDKYSLPVTPREAKQGKKNALGNSFVYENVKFVGYEDELTCCEFRDVVLADDKKHFTALMEWNDYFNDVTEFAERISANLNRLYVYHHWVVRVYYGENSYYVVGQNTRPTGVVGGKKCITLSFSNENVWDALAHIKDDFDLNFVIRGRTITIGAVGRELSKYLSYGKGNGLKRIERNTDESQAIITRLRAYGNETNMPLRFYQKAGIATTIKNDGVHLSFNYYPKGTYHKNTFVILCSEYFCSAEKAEAIFENVSGIKDADEMLIVKNLTKSCFKGLGYYGETHSIVNCNGKQARIPIVAFNDGKTVCAVFFFNTDNSTQDSIINDVYDNNKVMYVNEATNVEYWPVEWQTAKATSIPDNMNVKNLMLRGFGEPDGTTLDSIVRDIYNTTLYSAAYDALVELGYNTLDSLLADFDFSTNPNDSWIQSKNAADLGVKEGSVTFDGSVEDYDDIYPSIKYAGASNVISRADVITDNGVFDTEKTIPNFTVDVALDFNPKDYISYGKTSFNVHMQDGFCGGRDFECVGVKLLSSNTYRLTLQRSNDSTLSLYFPYNASSGNAYQIMAGDTFVMTDIDMPKEYVYLTSINKLLPSAIRYLRDNCTPKYTFSLDVDPVQMQKFCDEQTAANQSTIHDTIKAGDRVGFFDNDLGISASITIDKLTIKEGNGLPEYEITLSDDKIVGKIQKMQSQINSIVSGNSSSGVDNAAMRALIAEVGDERYMRSKEDTGTTGSISVGKSLKSRGYNAGINGYKIDEQGNADFNSLKVREFLEVPELRYNRTTIRTGVTWQTFGGGIVEEVVQDFNEDGEMLDTGTITLKLEDGEIGAVEVGDLCMGIWHNLDTDDNEDESSDDNHGNFAFAGFATIYFRVTSILENDHSKFTYELRQDEGHWSGRHPRNGMNFAAYANDDEDKEDRKASQYSTTEYTIMLKEMDDWEFDGSNIVYVQGKLDGFSIPASRLKNDGTWEDYNKDLSGEGICFGNAYMYGTINQFQRTKTVSSKIAYYLGDNSNPDDMHDAWLTNKSEIIAAMSSTPVDTTAYDYVYQSWKTTYNDSYVEWSEPQCISQKGVAGTSPVIVQADYDTITFPTDNGNVSTGSVPRTITFSAYKGSNPVSVLSLAPTLENGNGSLNIQQVSQYSLRITPVVGATWGVDKTLSVDVIVNNGSSNIRITKKINITGSAKGQTVTGPQGTGVSGMVEQWQATETNDASTLSADNWSNSHIEPTASLPYVWNREIVSYYNPATSTTTADTTEAHICCTFSDGIVSHISWYCITTTNDEPEDGYFDDYKDDVQSAIENMDNTSRYLWNWERTYYKDSNKKTSVKRLLCVAGEKGANGDKGIDGCVVRTCGEYDSSTSYYNDSTRKTPRNGETVRYIDVVQYEDSEGNLVYYQRTTYKSGEAGYPPSSSGSNSYWTKANMFDFIASKVIMTDEMWAKTLQGKSVYIVDSNNDVVAGIHDKGSSKPVIFAGATNNDTTTANFRVNMDGTMYSKNAEIEGTIRADHGYFAGQLFRTKTIINENNYYDYAILFEEGEEYELHFDKLGNWIELNGTAPTYTKQWSLVVKCLYPNGDRYGESLDDVRRYIGSSIVIVNKSNSLLGITGALTDQDNPKSFNSYPVAQNYMAILECKLGFINNKETIYWKITRGCCQQ